MTPTQVRKLRKRLGLTQQEFANLLGLRHRSSVCHLEDTRKHREPTGALLRLLSAIEKNPGIAVDGGQHAV